MGAFFFTTRKLTEDEKLQIRISNKLRAPDGMKWFDCDGGAAGAGVYDRLNSKPFEQDSHRGLLAVWDGFFSCPGEAGSVLDFYKKEGAGGLSRLEGFFSLVIIDEKSGKIILYRDPSGSRPLYYSDQEGLFSCASRICSLTMTGLAGRRTETVSTDLYLAMITLPDPYTYFSDVRQLRAGGIMVKDLNSGSCETDIAFNMFSSTLSCGEGDRKPDDALIDDVRKAVKGAVSRCLRTDDPGAFLSGGFDTTAVVGLASRMRDKPLKTFTIGYTGDDEYGKFNEFDYAKAIAGKFGTEHYEFGFKAHDVYDEMPMIVRSMEQPSGDAINSYLVSKFASQECDAALTGTGGDEIFVGSHWYYQLFRLNKFERFVEHLSPSFRRKLLEIFKSEGGKVSENRLLRRINRLLTYSLGTAEKYEHLKFVFKNDERPALYREDFFKSLPEPEISDKVIRRLLSEIDGISEFDQFFYLFVQHEVINLQIRDLDQMSFAHSLEARSPLMDKNVLRAAAVLPFRLKYGDMGLRTSMIKALGDFLPEVTRKRKKMSFIVPMSVWARGCLKSAIQRLLSPASMERRGRFKADEVRRIVDDFYSGKEKAPFKLWNLALLELWERIHIDRNHGEGIMPETDLMELIEDTDP